jgi:hypothetical protein
MLAALTGRMPNTPGNKSLRRITQRSVWDRDLDAQAWAASAQTPATLGRPSIAPENLLHARLMQGSFLNGSLPENAVDGGGVAGLSTNQISTGGNTVSTLVRPDNAIVTLIRQILKDGLCK